ncbi:hypothetical protein ACFVXG_02670 [Kitasatospora sp. NPDC058162]|uniref:hypothetical protein n=1 Tax=Kitasatospora sp. NPDC058162 TaxID=3346362 RepID=UPI0036DBAC8C
MGTTQALAATTTTAAATAARERLPMFPMRALKSINDHSPDCTRTCTFTEVDDVSRIERGSTVGRP